MAVEKTIKLKLNAAEALSDLKKIRGEIDITYAELRRTTPIELDGSKAKSELKSVGSEIGKTSKGAKEIGKSAEGSVGGFKKLKISTQAFGLALKATGIGLIVALFVKLQEALGKNQAVMDSFNVITETISITFQELVNKVVKATQTAVKFFSKVGKFIKKFATQDLDGLTSYYEKNNEVVETTIQKNRRLAKELVGLRNEVKLAEAEQRLLQLTYQKEAEIQRQIRDDVSLTMEERIAANTKLGEILDTQFEEERTISEQKLELAEKELAKNKDNIDLQVAVINAKTELADLDERITGQRSEQLINLTTLQREQADALQAIQDKKDEEAQKAQEIIDAALAAEQKAADDLLKLKQKEAADLLALQIKSDAEKKKAKEDQIASVKAMEIQAAQSMLGSLGQLAGEGTKMAKATAITQILINTAQGISGAIKAGAGLVFPANLGAIATGVASVLAGIASAKGILAKVPGGDDGGTESVNISSAPTGGISGMIPNLENISPTGNGDMQPVQAFVVENDISNAQALQEELDIQATL